MKILVADDDPQLVRALRITLAAHGYDVVAAADGAAAISLAAKEHPDIVLLDLGMPHLNGVQVIEALRGWTSAPIVVVSGRTGSADKVEALDAGADDFVTKPFSTPELMARVRAALRRIPLAQASHGKLRVGELLIDFASRTVTNPAGTEHLTPKELDLLRYLTQHPNEAVAHRELLQAVWGPDYGDQVDYLRVFIKNLRKKIEPNPERPRYITTEPWVGYRFNGLPEPA